LQLGIHTSIDFQDCMLLFLLTCHRLVLVMFLLCMTQLWSRLYTDVLAAIFCMIFRCKYHTGGCRWPFSLHIWITVNPYPGKSWEMTPSPLLPLYIRNCEICSHVLLGHCPGIRGLFTAV